MYIYLLKTLVQPHVNSDQILHNTSKDIPCLTSDMHVWTKGIIARRLGHVFRMALHNEGDWRMETLQQARQGELSCLHTPIPELCNAILNTCQMPSRFYIIPSNVNKSQTHLLKPFIARDLTEGHICRQNMLMFALVFCLNCVHAPPARAVIAISLWKIQFMTASAVS